jgi:hypothetical protein
VWWLGVAGITSRYCYEVVLSAQLNGMGDNGKSRTRLQLSRTYSQQT